MRSTLDRLISIGGLVLAIVLLVAGGLLLWANIYITNEVHDQLAAQNINMPTDETGLADLPTDDKAALEPYAGQQMTTGSQARAYADHFIAVHLSEVADGKTYSEVSGAYLASCSEPAAAETANCQTLSAEKATLFQGETLRGLLLYGAAFATVGTFALYGAIVAFVAGVVLLVLAFLGFRHARRSSDAPPQRDLASRGASSRYIEEPSRMRGSSPSQRFRRDFAESMSARRAGHRGAVR